MARAAEHRFGETALAGAKRRMRKGQCGERAITLVAMRQLAVGPRDETIGQRFEEAPQLVGRQVALERRLVLRAHVVVDERHRDARQAELAAHQPAVHLRLCPVQQAVIGRHAIELALEGLDLLEPAALRIPAVGAAAHDEVPVLAGQRQLGAIARTAPRRHRLVPGHALLRAGRRREAQLEVAFLRSEFAERADGDGVRLHRLR